jgi:hypothetical protein
VPVPSPTNGRDIMAAPSAEDDELARHAAASFIHRAKSTSAYFWQVPAGYSTTSKSSIGAFNFDMEQATYTGDSASAALNTRPSATYIPAPSRMVPGYNRRTFAVAGTVGQSRTSDGKNKWIPGEPATAPLAESSAP